MKKIYISILLSICFIGFSQVVITRVVDTNLSTAGCNGADGPNDPTIIELYVNGTVNFSGYKFGMEQDGFLDPSEEQWREEDISGLGTVTNDFAYIVQFGLNTFDDLLPNRTRVGVNITHIEGNDAVRITDGSNVLDQYGDPSEITGTFDFSADWTYLTSYAQRKNNTNPSATFNINDWIVHDANVLLDADCSLVRILVGFEGYSNTNFLATSDVQNKEDVISIYVNAAKELEVNGAEVAAIQVYDLNGRVVAKSNAERVSVVDLEDGVYIALIQDNDGNTFTKKFIKR